MGGRYGINLLVHDLALNLRTSITIMGILCMYRETQGSLADQHLDGLVAPAPQVLQVFQEIRGNRACLASMGCWERQDVRAFLGVRVHLVDQEHQVRWVNIMTRFLHEGHSL